MKHMMCHFPIGRCSQTLTCDTQVLGSMQVVDDTMGF